MTELKNKKWLILAVIALALYLSPLFILGKDSHVRIHDHLDSSVVWYKMLAESDKIFASNDATIPNMMNGLPRVALGSEFKFIVWLFILFPPFVAHIINAVVVRFIAFIGMYLLLDKFVLRQPSHELEKTQKGYRALDIDGFLKAGVSLCFAALPFYLPGSLSIAGIPLAAYAFLNFRYKQPKVRDWLIICLLPFASDFVLTFFFFLAAMGIIWLIDWIRSTRSNMTFFTAIAVMTAIFLAKNYRLITSVLLGEGFPSQRDVFSRGHNTFHRTLGLAWENFTTAHTHAYTLQDTIIFYVAAFFFAWIIIKQLLHWMHVSPTTNLYERRLFIVIILAACFSMWYAFWYWQGFRAIKDNIDFANTFNFGRTHMLNPILWYLIFALGLKLILTKSKRFHFRSLGFVLVFALIVGQVYVVYDENHELKYRRNNNPSWHEFYSPQLFSNIKHYIGKDPADYRVASIGMHPAIAQYNGLYTLDLYVTMYPLAYKHKFRKIIAPELHKSHTIEKYFDTWGSRAYIYTDELGKHYMFTKNKDRTLDHLDLNTKAFKAMGGDYILSAVKITNADENGLKLLHTFSNKSSAWRIFLYKA